MIKLMSQDDQESNENFKISKKISKKSRKISTICHEEVQSREGALFNMALYSFLIFGGRPFWFY